MIEDIIAEYKTYLGQKHGDQTLKQFDDRLNDNHEAAISEALVFNWLCGIDQNPELHEHSSLGGADFICSPSSNYKYLVEVTCLGEQALTEETGCHMRPGQLMALGSPTRILRQRVSDKASQLGGHDIPTVLAITSLHDGAYILLSPDEAVKFLISDWAFTIPIGGRGEDTFLSTDLKQSIFFRRDGHESSRIVPCRQSVSAVLLMPIAGDRLNAIGILHPEPSRPFSYHVLEKVPFIRVSNWPIDGGEIFTEWAVSKPYASAFSHFNNINRMLRRR